MKFQINRNLLDSTLQNVSRGLSNKTPMPILTGVLLNATDDKLILTTTNKEISVQVTLQASKDLLIFETGSCVVPGKYFVEIIKKLDGDQVEITLFEENTIKIISNKSDFTLIAYDRNNFPVPDFTKKGNSFELKNKVFKQIIRQTSFACATTENRIILTSVNFELKSNQLLVIATDSYRLAKRSLMLENEAENIKINIPSKSLEELNKILPENDEIVCITVNPDKILFEYNNIVFMTRLVEGDYPDTSSLLSGKYDFAVTFNRNSLLSSVGRASLFAESDNLSLIKFNFSSNKENIEISSNSTEVGRVVEDILPVNKSKDIDFQIAFSAKYLLDALKSFDTNEVSIHFTGEIKPAIITNEDDDSLNQLLLPVRSF